MQQINVRALKGAPLSIVIVLMLQRRSVSHSLLCQETGYSDRTVTQALEYLTSNQIVTRAGHSGFQLTGDSYQLPLYWEEKTEPADPSPALAAPEISLPEAAPENFSGKKYESENEVIVKITTMENRIRELEDRITALESAENRKFYDLKPAEIVNSTPLINESINKDTDKEVNQDLLINSELREICDEYNRRNRDGICYTDLQLDQLIRMNPDPEVLEFVLPRARTFESAQKWAKFDIRHVKYHLLKMFGVGMPALQRITDNTDISIWMIDYHYWYWYLMEQQSHPNLKLGWAVSKMEKCLDKLKAENSDPLQYRYL